MKELWIALLVVVLATPAMMAKAKKKAPRSERERLTERIEKTRKRLAEVSVDQAPARELEKSALAYLAGAERRIAEEWYSQADGLSKAADALTRAVDHIRHSLDPSRTGYPAREDQSRRLEQAYFRLQQADYFQVQSKDARARPLVRAARQFYQRARQAWDRGDSRSTDEFTKVTEDIVKALEHLAHTATPVPVPPRLK
ncbi:MAG: hypothetical protein HY822_04015 [Acidobacteria bacterium]|nr:hypothetical protein [Acidobacteriota bacterium]